MNIVLFGPPACGKGTQSKLLADAYQMLHVSTGELFRKHMVEQTEIGQIVSQRMKDGTLIDDELTIRILKEAIQNKTNNILLDGFPRTLKQAQMLELILEIDYVIVFNIERSTLEQRIEQRKKHEHREDDDKLPHRLTQYYEKTVKTLTHYDQKKLIMIDAEMSITDVFKSIVDQI